MRFADGVERILLVLVTCPTSRPSPRHEFALPKPCCTSIVADGAVDGINIPSSRRAARRGRPCCRRRILGHALLEHIVGVAVVAESRLAIFRRVLAICLGAPPIIELAAQRARVRSTLTAPSAQDPTSRLREGARSSGPTSVTVQPCSPRVPTSATSPSFTKPGSSATDLQVSDIPPLKALVAASEF